MSDSRMLPMCGEGITKNMSHQLIIIGNGFDIECGLNSRFYQFFEPRMHVIETIDDLEDPGSVNALCELSITAWDVVIYVRRQLVNKGEGINWCDVEAVISDVIGMEGKASEDHGPDVPSLPGNERVTVASLMSFFEFLDAYHWIDKPREYYRSFNERLDDAEHDEIAKMKEELIELMYGDGSLGNGRERGKRWKHAVTWGFEDCDPYNFLEFIEGQLPNEGSEMVGQYLRFAYPENERWSPSLIRSALEEELHVLENEFKDYLSGQVEGNEKYRERADELLCEILRYDTSKDGGNLATILNFNYTTPSIPCLVSFDRAPRLVNVHGSLDEEIIFGADGTYCMGDSGAARFSKTYRLLSLDRLGLQGSVAFPPGHRISDIETRALKFYGHSLSRADYAYFLSVFDIVDLYSGNVVLYFFYRPYSPTARRDLLLNISKLLDAYGVSMDNRDHGKNLMHRLLLEDRLVVHELE